MVHETITDTPEAHEGKNFRIISTPLTDEQGDVIAVIEVVDDITIERRAKLELKESEARLRKQKKGLEQKNIAMREIMAQLEGEKARIQENISQNIQKLILPSLEKLKFESKSQGVDILRQNLLDITSSFGSQLNREKIELTPKEIQICDLIRKGFTNKEIADHMIISVKTVEAHRKKIRKKLKLTNKKINLQTFLQYT